ncbi:MAG: leucine--tRNA ligase [Planctomycetota bacterium]|jgi:leucyl-tRNA synthetase
MSQPDKNPHRYNATYANDIEVKWQEWWKEQGTYRQSNPGDPGFDAGRPRFYCLDMFPYPSGAGLHVGHPEGYTATDIISRYKRMCGFNVLHPMGFDAFGLPAEQYAVRTGVHPAITTKEAIVRYRATLQRFGFSYDWDREFATIDPDYYKWTQWIFLKIYNSWYDTAKDKARPISELVEKLEKGRLGVKVLGGVADMRASEPISTYEGTAPDVVKWTELDRLQQRDFIDAQRLAYVGEQTVNWCPKLGTALSNEEVIDGRSERGGHPVFRKPLKQWMLRITAYADRLLRDLDGLDWPESTATMQTEWIGKSTGADIDFELAECAEPYLRVYTTRPDTVFGATYMVIAPEHPLMEHVQSEEARAYAKEARNRSDLERQESKEKTGAYTGIDAINPATGLEIPVWVADYVLMGYGHGAIMAVPGGDQRDWDFAKAFGLPIVRTVQPPEGFSDDEAYTGEGPAINSGFLDGLDVAGAKARIIEWLEENGTGRARVNFRLRDWLFSRQRYWGEPFPVVWDEHGHHHAVGESALPVLLPEMEDFIPEESEDPQPMLAKAHDWLETTAGEAGVADLPGDARVTRETNTMPNWAGSCWYYLRYCDPRNPERLAGPEAMAYWMGERGVDLYIGGAEHAVLHLLYARFWHKVLYDLGEVTSPEPFQKLFHQGMITSFAYERPDRTLAPVDEVEERGDTYVETATGQEVKQVVAKMSKSLKNVIAADDAIAEYGVDTFRLYEMYMGALADSAPWNPRDTVGMYRFLQRAWRLMIDEQSGETRFVKHADGDVEKKLHRAIAKVGADIDKLAFNTAIAAMIDVVNAADGLTEDQADRFARMLAPFAPHLCEEIWHRMGREGSVATAEWPAHDEAMLVDDVADVVVQVLGKVRSRVQVPAGADKDEHERLALADEKIAKLVEGKTVRKVIVVPGKLVNIVAN